jgi:2-oxoglutarate ferredoxin oxidoreductase subunit gamma
MNVSFAGFGGQGIVLLGIVLGQSAARSGKNALQTQSYGPEARGGACHSTVIVSDGRISEIEPEVLDILVAMSQPAYDKYSNILREDGRLLFDSELVKPSGRGGRGIPATGLARGKLGKELYANIVMFGFFVKSSGIVDRSVAREAIETAVPKGTAEANLKAFDVGYEYAD